MKLVKILLISLLSLCLFGPTFADENYYQVMDAKGGYSEGFDNYNDALDSYLNNKDGYDNLILLKNNKVIDMEYGIVEFPNLCEYYSVNRKEKDYISGTYGIDGAYLYTENDKVYFVIAGDRGYASINDVALHPYESLGVKVSNYSILNDNLYHNIKTQLQYEFNSNSLCLDSKPNFMKDSKTYYSYDGHYFYEDFHTMIDDYKSESYENAANSEPYYNYYEYLPHRSLSNYSLKEVEDYFNNALCFNNRLTDYRDINGDNASDIVNKSQLYSNIDEFYNCQNIYGSNMMMLIASGIVESSYGKNLNSYLNNNLFINAAYESQHEKDNNRYDSIANSIYSHAKYFISSLYSNYLKSNYHGTYFGNKMGGINIEYCLDHYYGEKAASEYYKLDNSLGLKDRNSEAIAIFNNLGPIHIYNDDSLSNLLHTISGVEELALVILEEGETYYKVQLDSSFNDEYLYDFNGSVGYINKEDVSYVLNKNSIHSYDLIKVNYDFNGGAYHDYSSISIKSLNGLVDPSIKPLLDGYEFVGYESIVDEDGTLVYKANYKKIDEIAIEYLYEKQGELLPYPDLCKAKLLVKYEDGSKNHIDINTDMVSAYNPKDFDSQTIEVTYCGLKVYKDIQIDSSYYAAYDDLSKAITNSDAKYVKENIDIVDYPYTMSDIRNLDIILRQENNRNYVIKDNTKSYDISISGLDLSLDDRSNFNLIEDTYYVIVDDIKPYSYRKLVNIGSGHGFTVEAGINISFKFNYQNIDLRGPAIVQLDLADKPKDRIYSVYHCDSDGNIVKCRTTQSNNYVQFIIEGKGDYLLLSMPSNNTYKIADTIENLSYENIGFDSNRINLEFLLGLSLIVVSLIGILIYYQLENNKDRTWKDYKKSLLRADTVQEEKQKN